MSRHQVDKFMWWVEAHDAEVRAYAADPAGYVSAWEARAGRVPTADSGVFTDEERDALATVDHAALYALGAHPYLLWHFVEGVRVWAGGVPFPEMSARFRDDAATVPRPDHST